jgi:hypothetical protein|tara:strand:+ start:119 stop:397 length:279 start_codon:yes stop_codon:yes gene_type:complete
MNGKKAKSVRTKAKYLFIEWIGSFLTDEQKAQISINNYKELLPDETHIYTQGRLMHSVYSFKWFVKHIKRISKSKDIDAITLQDVMSDARLS